MTDASTHTASARRSILITGATGFIGARLATAALERGYIVRTLTRNDWSSAPWVPTGQRFFGSLPSQIPPSLCDGIDVVVHCAADVAGAGRQAAAVNVDGTRRLAEQASAAGVSTFIFLSSQSARSDAPSAYGQTKYAAEQALRSVAGLRTVILRPGVVDRPGQSGHLRADGPDGEDLPVLPLLDGGRALVQPIHVDDLCEAIFLADARSEAARRLDPQPGRSARLHAGANSWRTSRTHF